MVMEDVGKKSVTFEEGGQCASSQVHVPYINTIILVENGT